MDLTQQPPLDASPAEPAVTTITPITCYADYVAADRRGAALAKKFEAGEMTAEESATLELLSRQVQEYLDGAFVAGQIDGRPLSFAQRQKVRRLALRKRRDNSFKPSTDQPLLNTQRYGRNDPCHCGSGKKFKHCHREAA